MKKQIFALAAFAMLGAMVITSCAKDPEASPMSATYGDDANSVVVKGNVYYAKDSIQSRNATVAGLRDTLATAPQGVLIVVKVAYADLGITTATGNWTQTVTTNSKGEFSLNVPVNAEYNATPLTIIAESFAGTQEKSKAGSVEGTFTSTGGGYMLGLAGTGVEAVGGTMMKGNRQYHVTIKYLKYGFVPNKSMVIY